MVTVLDGAATAVGPTGPRLVEVVRAEPVAAGLRRLTLAGGCLRGVPDLGGDLFVRLFLPRPGRASPVLPRDPEHWWPEMQSIPARRGPPGPAPAGRPDCCCRAATTRRLATRPGSSSSATRRRSPRSRGAGGDGRRAAPAGRGRGPGERARRRWSGRCGGTSGRRACPGRGCTPAATGGRGSPPTPVDVPTRPGTRCGDGLGRTARDRCALTRCPGQATTAAAGPRRRWSPGPVGGPGSTQTGRRTTSPARPRRAQALAWPARPEDEGAGMATRRSVLP